MCMFIQPFYLYNLIDDIVIDLWQFSSRSRPSSIYKTNTFDALTLVKYWRDKNLFSLLSQHNIAYTWTCYAEQIPITKVSTRTNLYFSSQIGVSFIIWNYW